MRKKIVYIGSFCISKMDAQSQLVIGNSKVLQDLGYEVTLIGNDPDLALRNTSEKRHVDVEGFKCYNVFFSKSLSGLLHSKGLFSEVKEILKNIGLDKIKYIICYGSVGFANQLCFLSEYANKNGIKIIYNCVDIPVQNHGTFIQRIVKKVDRSYMHWIIANKMDGLIAVSKYIEKFFLEKKPNFITTVIPPLRDIKIKSIVKHNCYQRKNIVYLGVPFPIDGRKVEESAYKDRIDLFIDLLALIDDAESKCKFDVYGLTKEQYLKVVYRQADFINAHPELVKFHGRINHNEAERIVAEADYSLVYRLKTQMTMAGFSTKFVESISCGTPVIMTDTSEYTEYINKGIPCIMLDLDDVDRQKEVLKAALNKLPEEILDMKKKCISSGVFDYRNYLEKIEGFLNRI